jgi:hypothetical protein
LVFRLPHAPVLPDDININFEEFAKKEEEEEKEAEMIELEKKRMAKKELSETYNASDVYCCCFKKF